MRPLHMAKNTLPKKPMPFPYFVHFVVNQTPTAQEHLYLPFLPYFYKDFLNLLNV